MTVFISECIAGHYYLAKLNPKAGDMLLWWLVPHSFDGKITRIPMKQVPRKTWRRAYRMLIEDDDTVLPPLHMREG